MGALFLATDFFVVTAFFVAGRFVTGFLAAGFASGFLVVAFLAGAFFAATFFTVELGFFCLAALAGAGEAFLPTFLAAVLEAFTPDFGLAAGALVALDLTALVAPAAFFLAVREETDRELDAADDFRSGDVFLVVRFLGLNVFFPST